MRFGKIPPFFFLISTLLLGPFLFPCFIEAQEPIPVVVTLPVLKDLVEKVGKDHLRVEVLITGLESEHTYTPKPSHILAVQKAKLLVKVGLGLEVWVDSLIKNADRPDLLIVTSSQGVPLIRDPGSPYEGKDSHDHLGNPHIWLDPENVKIMVRRITNGLSQIDPDHQEAYQKNEASFVFALDRLTEEMIDRAKRLSSSRRKIITHHPAWPYFAKRFGFVIVGEIQTQVGSEPSAKRMGGLIQRIRQEEVGAILSEPQLNQTMPQILAQETGARLVILSPLPGVLPKTEDYLDFIRYNVVTLVNALEGS